MYFHFIKNDVFFYLYSCIFNGLRYVYYFGVIELGVKGS
jgi:hypothetical protein